MEQTGNNADIDFARTWQCPKCKRILSVACGEIVEMKIPVCFGCGIAMELLGWSIRGT